MSTSAVDLAPSVPARAPASTVAIKAVAAITGVVLTLYVIGHLLGNLQIFLPNAKEDLRNYAAMLHRYPALLWTVRVFLIVAILLHMWAYIVLGLRKLKARPIGYKMKKAAGSSLASRMMYWTGPFIALYVIYHILHLTTGTVHPDFLEGDPYDNVVIGFRYYPVSIAYIIAIILLCMHLYHGMWSWLQTLGFSHPRYTPAIKRLAAVLAILIAAGYIAIPVAVMTGLVQ